MIILRTKVSIVINSYNGYILTDTQVVVKELCQVVNKRTIKKID